MYIKKQKYLLVTYGLMLSMMGCITMPQTTDNDPSSEFIKLDECKLHVKTFGDKGNPPVLVVHGGPGGDSNYLYSLRELSKYYYVIFYDQRSSGLSPRTPQEELTLESSLNDLIQIIEHYSNGRKIKLIGHSWGAMLVIGYLGRHGDRVSHAVAVEPGILNSTSAKEFVSQIKKHQTIWDIFSLGGYISRSLLVSSHDCRERFDYVMTKMMNRNALGSPYQCKNESMPDNSFIRAGYGAFNNMLKPVFDNPNTFKADLMQGISNYKQ